MSLLRATLGKKPLRSAPALTHIGGSSYHASAPSRDVKVEVSSPLYKSGGVHGGVLGGKKGAWRNKPLFRREGDQRFRTGLEASEMLMAEASRKYPASSQFTESLGDVLPALAPVFDRSPKYAWIAKQLLEPERMVQFRVAWLDDSGTSRVNRGFRVQYSSALGPYEGGLHFSSNMNSATLKALGIEGTLANALTGCALGGAVGGADFNPHNKSEAEIQRFCQSFMTELANYVGPDTDIPSMGYGIGPTEIGYLYGQYKRVTHHNTQSGRGMLWGGSPPYPQATGYGIVHFANSLLADKKDSLRGKRCLVTGTGKVALAVAEKLLEYGAIPLSLTDSSGHIYEPDGIDNAKLKVISKIKSERGARIGRYIIASTTAQYNDPENLYTVPCDMVFPCAARDEIDASAATILADNGCIAVIEGANGSCTRDAKAVMRKRGVSLGPHMATMCAGGIVSGLELATNPIAPGEDWEQRVKGGMDRVYQDIKMAAKEYNTRGDLNAGASISAFTKVADVMAKHGVV
ncbi:unnamed protein product [Chrysoparadoxa australica]